jgi:hypothetical protein
VLLGLCAMQAFSALEKRGWNEMNSGFSGMGL